LETQPFFIFESFESLHSSEVNFEAFNMQYTLLVVTLGCLAASVSVQGQMKVCLKVSDECQVVGAQAKLKVLQIRSIPISDSTTDLTNYIVKLQELFNITSQANCPVELCGCKDNTLVCDLLINKIRGALQGTQPPTCISKNEKAQQVIAQLKMALDAGDRAKIVGILEKVLRKISEELSASTRTDAENQELVSCLKETVIGLRTMVKEHLSKFRPQLTCEFCTGAANSRVFPSLFHARRQS
jgi:hypothetical protein